jgi:hypothetical protein
MGVIAVQNSGPCFVLYRFAPFPFCFSRSLVPALQQGVSLMAEQAQLADATSRVFECVARRAGAQGTAELHCATPVPNFCLSWPRMFRAQTSSRPAMQCRDSLAARTCCLSCVDRLPSHNSMRSAAQLSRTRMTLSPRRNILLMNRSLLTPLSLPLFSVHISFTFSSTILQWRSKALTRASSLRLLRQLIRTWVWFRVAVMRIERGPVWSSCCSRMETSYSLVVY